MPFSTAVARSAVTAAIVISFVPVFWFLPISTLTGIVYLVLVISADTVFIVSTAYLPDRLHWEQTISKVGMTVALLAFLAVAFR
jgi:4-hydroxybenzoate polyprenyltransferase